MGHEHNIYLMDDPEEMLKPWVAHPFFFEIAIVHAVVFIFGLIGNVTVIVAMAGDRRARSATNTFLVSLAVGDLLMLCVTGPLETYYYFVIQWDEKSIICKTAKLAELLSAISSVLNLLAVTIERFVVIVFPMKSRTLCTMANILRAVLGVWLLAVVLSIPILFSTGTYKNTFTNNVTTITLNYCDYSLIHPSIVIYEFFVIFVFPSVLLTICYSFVIRELWASTRKMSLLTQGSFSRQGSQKRRKPPSKGLITETETEELDPSKPEKKCAVGALRKLLARKKNSRLEIVSPQGKDEANAARKQVIKMLILVVILFFVCWGPRLIMDVIQKYSRLPFGQSVYRMRIAFNIMTFLHACINPFIYCFMSKNFRARFVKFLKLCGNCSKKRRANDIVLVPVLSQRSQSGSSIIKKTGLRRGKCARRNISKPETESTHIICLDVGQTDGSKDVVVF